MRIPYGKGIQLYARSPPLFQNLSTYLLRPISRSTLLGSGFFAFRRELEKTQWLTAEELKAYQEKRLRRLIRHAYSNVPYYHRIFKENNLSVNDIQRIDDLKKIPFLTKDIIRKNFKDLIAVNAPEFRYGQNSTSGSSGTPVTFFLDQQNREMEFALKWRQREWANIGLNDNIATYRRFRALRGVDYGTCKPMWKFNPLSKELEFNVFGLNTETLKKQVAKLQSFHPRLIEGCPSTISLVAKFIKDWRIPFSVNAVQTSSESLATRREMIEEGFHCKVYDRYGHSEYAVSASECPDGCYHVTEGGIMEFIKDGEAISNGELGEIVGTGLYNYSMPLIRYRTVDMARPSDERCTCGRGLSTIHSIEGRVSDSILTFDERIITGPSFEGYWKNVISPLTPHLAYVHIVQYSKTEITVRIVKMPGYLEKEGVAIVRGLGNLLGSEVEVTFEELSAVPIQKKWRFSESKIDQCLL